MGKFICNVYSCKNYNSVFFLQVDDEKKSQKNQNILGSFSLVVSVTKRQMNH